MQHYIYSKINIDPLEEANNETSLKFYHIPLLVLLVHYKSMYFNDILRLSQNGNETSQLRTYIFM